MDNVLKKIITISSVETIKRKIDGVLLGFNVFDENGAKYALWQLKKDKSTTKAYTQFKSQGLVPGASVGIAYKEEPNTYEYVDAKGESRVKKSVNRTILWLSEPDNIEEFDERFKNVTQEIKEISSAVDEEEEEKIDVSKIPF